MIFGRKRPEPAIGDEVMTSDEEHLGEVTAVYPDHLDVASGPLSALRWAIPRTEVTRIDDGLIRLAVSRGQAMARGWSQRAAEPDAPSNDESLPSSRS